MHDVWITLQSPGNDPVRFAYARVVPTAQAIAAAAQILADHDSPRDDMPASVRPTLLRVEIVPA